MPATGTTITLPGSTMLHGFDGSADKVAERFSQAEDGHAGPPHADRSHSSARVKLTPLRESPVWLRS